MNITRKIRTVDESGNPRELNEDEMSKAMGLNISIDRHDDLVLYRGVSKEYLADRLIKEYEEPKDHTIASRLFFFGEKSVHFRNELKIKQERNYLKDIEDITSVTSNKIFDLINGLRKSNDENIISYQINNPVFFDFFLNKKNKKMFSNMISSLGQEARDYFLSFLHTAGKVGIGRRSTSISTSYSLEQAKLFARQSTECGFVIVSVKRLNQTDLIIDSLLADMNKYGIPTLPKNSAIFELQEEETLRSGIFPHDIVGVECLHSGEFIVNPFIFSYDNINVDIFLNSLDIDQKEFSKNISKYTNYSSYFYTYDRKYYSEDIAD